MFRIQEMFTANSIVTHYVEEHHSGVKYGVELGELLLSVSSVAISHCTPMLIVLVEVFIRLLMLREITVSGQV